MSQPQQTRGATTTTTTTMGDDDYGRRTTTMTTTTTTACAHVPHALRALSLFSGNTDDHRHVHPTHRSVLRLRNSLRLSGTQTHTFTHTRTHIRLRYSRERVCCSTNNTTITTTSTTTNAISYLTLDSVHETHRRHRNTSRTAQKPTHTYTHTHASLCVCVCVCERVMRGDVVAKKCAENKHARPTLKLSYTLRRVSPHGRIRCACACAHIRSPAFAARVG